MSWDRNHMTASPEHNHIANDNIVHGDKRLSAFGRLVHALGTSTNGTPRSRIVAASLLLGLISMDVNGHAAASTNLFYFFGRICISVYDLQQDHAPRIRDDLSDIVAPQLEQATKQLNKRLSVLSRPNCIKPNDRRFDSQLSLELFVKRQTITVGGNEFNLAIVGGSSSNGRGPLSDYELQPTVLIERHAITESAIGEALVQYVKRAVLPIMKN